MTAISTRSSVLAVKVETVEGTPELPTAATDYIAIQDDFDMSPEFESLENAENKASIAPGKPIQGAEAPTANFSHYLRHSGTEGTAPGYRQLLKGLFGAEVVAGAEFLTAVGSTTSLIKSTGASTNFERGEGLLVKDGANGYKIRAVESASGDDITPSFNVSVAPGTGVGLGKAVLYKPANTGHQALSLWHYIGNGGAVQLLAGGKVAEAAISIVAGELINVAYSVEGLSFFFNPITLAATDTKLDFTDDDGTFAATIVAGTYKDPHDLADAVTAAMNTANAGETHTVTYSDTTGKYTITSTGAVLSLLWFTGANAANTIGDKLGFSTAADDTGALTYASDNPITISSPQTPTFDNADSLAAKNNEIMIGSQSDFACVVTSECTVTITDTIRKTPSVCAASGNAASVVNERLVVITATTQLEQYDVDFFKKFRLNDNVRFQYSFGTKSGGNWIAGKSGCIYLSTGTITGWDINDDEGVASLELEITGYANATGDGEIYLNFL